MKVLHDFRCVNCGVCYEEMQEPEVNEIKCTICGNACKKTFDKWYIRKPMAFPAGIFHGLPNEPYITSRRQLREEVKKAGKDKFTECYARYDDGYAGF